METERQRRSTFVLITTVPRAEAGARELLREYKFQGSLERRFAFLKDPEIVDSFFVKKSERVLALGYVLLMVCLVFYADSGIMPIRREKSLGLKVNGLAKSA